MSNHIFTLDIGTQSVTGIILEENDSTYTILDYCMKEHNERAMLDGQIHHVVQVAEVIQQVKETLENKHGKLTSVSVAAAGRALKTVQAEATIPLRKQPITTEEAIKHLELSAVQKAQKKLIELERDDPSADYYCVGYSVLHYKLDDQQIGSLIDQSGEHASVQIIATFLPTVIVESLLAALQRANLQMDALTLEPIAAIHVLIPESMRRLNVALVDIGAGTSDIAITNHGTVVAYGMVPIAGDAITEAMSDHYLLDFPRAEQAKRKVVSDGEIVIQDILGFEVTITYEDVVQALSENIEKLADHLTEEMLQLNTKTPQAIMLIGGGSLTPGITTTLAQKLQLPENRVAVRDVDAIQDIHNVAMLPAGPDFVTPIGIAIAAKQNPVHYVTVTVNEQIVRLFEMTQLTVGDCLIQAGVEITKQYGIPGLAHIITVNDKEMTLPGQFGEPPIITLNDESATVECSIRDGDSVTIQTGVDGIESEVTIQELFDDMIPLTIFVNNEQQTIKSFFYVNGYRKDIDYVLQDKDDLIVDQPKTIADILSRLDYTRNLYNKPFPVFVNGKRVDSDAGQSKYTLNGKEVFTSQAIKQHDRLEIHFARSPRVTDILNQLKYTYWNTISVMFNGEEITLKQQALTITLNDRELNETSVLQPNDELKIQEKQERPFIFQDVFRYVEIDLVHIKGHYQLFENEKPTTFYEQLKNGDHLSIR